ncbi:MAG: hypothetical protein JW924_02585 [Fusobacteriaceae bacterium]|nr:hypothetical protein [Fusobacteriaceae bacterium]
MKYQASVGGSRPYKGLIVLIISFFILSLILFFKFPNTRTISLILMGVCLYMTTYSFLVNKKVYIEFLDDRIIYQSAFKKYNIFVPDIEKVNFKLKYPFDMIFGPLTIKVKCKNCSFFLNLCYFSPEVYDKFKKIK